jgi:hypothetical protein
VPAAARREVAREAASVLLAARDGGEPLIDDAFFPHERTREGRIPSEEAGDLYLFSASGVALAAGTAGEPVEPGHGGQHTTALDRPELDALFAVAGPGVAAGARPGRISNLDVAPTLAKLAGLPRPKDARGRELF